jgi:hypothetical protein
LFSVFCFFFKNIKQFIKHYYRIYKYYVTIYITIITYHTNCPVNAGDIPVMYAKGNAKELPELGKMQGRYPGEMLGRDDWKDDGQVSGDRRV